MPRGSAVDERYDAGRLIVADDHGELRAAWDRGAHRGVTLRTSAHPALDARLVRDARLVERAEASALPKVLDVVVARRSFVALSPVQGRSLRTLLDGDEPRTPREAVGWVREIATAVEALRRAGACAVGVRPEHVLVLDAAPEGVRELRVVGLGGLGGPVLEAHAPLDPRAWRYAPPEVVRGAPPDPRTDVYALGVLAHELLHGRPPPHTFESRFGEHGIESEDDASPLDAFLRHAVAVDPLVRFPNVDAFLEAWEALSPERSAEGWVRRVPPRVGQTFAERYRLVERLGRGGFGEVFLARLDEREVVVKISSSDARGMPSGDVVEPLLRLRHRHLAQVVEVASHRGRGFTVLERLVGPNAAEWRRAREHTEISDVLTIVCEVCLGLVGLHAAGIVHTDVKPANVILEEGRGAVLLDFDLARTPTALASESGRVLGTPGYLAPERILGRIREPYAHAIDLYSLGVLLFELLTGRLPFTGTTPSALARQHLSATPARLEDYRLDAPPALAALVRDLLARDPSERPATASAVLARLAASS